MKIIGQTERLLLRETSPMDGEIFYELNSDPEVIKYTGDPPFESVDAARRFLADYDHFQKYNRGRWAIIDRDDNTVMGWCGLKYHLDSGENDLGYRLFKKYWGQGYATEASHLALQFGFRRLGLESVIARAVKENVGSIKVMDKLGLEYEKDFEDHGSLCEQHRVDKYGYMILTPTNLEIKIY